MYQSLALLCQVKMHTQMHSRPWGILPKKIGRKRAKWTWKNHLANWINKMVKLLERWGI